MMHLDTQHPVLRSPDPDLAETLLLTTKLALPVVQPGTIVRQRLIERLNQGIQRRVTLVAAPAGFGKTSLLSAWAQQVQTPVGWVALDEGDNDPVRFWSYVITALDSAHPGVGASSLAVLRSPQAGSIERALTLVVNALATLSEPITLVLDDCHAITSAVVYQTLTFVIDHLPPQLHLVLASRINPPLPLARLRVRGELAEIRTEQLRFTVDEATALLRETLAVNIAAVDIDTLIARTEGWAAGLHLAGLSLQSQPDSTRFVASLRGSDRFILDYLVDEVLAQQPPAVQHFLLHTAILERLSAELCDAVVGLPAEAYIQPDGLSTSHGPFVTGRSQQMLEYLEQANLFTTPLDREGYWYRYHQLFAEFLRARLQRTQPELVPELHRRAAAWYEGAGQPADAVSHALAIGDHPWAARLIEAAADSLLQRAELATLMTWFHALPTAVVRARPRLCLVYALALVATSSFEIVEDWLAGAEAALDADRAGDAPILAPEEMRHELNSVRAIVAVLRGDITLGMGLTRESLVQLSFQNPFRQSLIAFLLALGYMWNDQIAAEDRALIATAVSGPLTDGALVSLRGTYSLAHLWSVHGRLRDAAALYRQALPPSLELSQSLPPVASLLYAGLGGILWEQNDLAGARRCALASIELGKTWARKRMILDSLLVLARVQQAEGDVPGANATMAQASQHGSQSSFFPWITSLIAASRARLDLLQGDSQAAARWAQIYESRSSESSPGLPVPVFRRAVADMILARVYIAQGRIDAARQVFATVLPMAEANQWRGVVIEILALQSLATSATGDDAEALATLIQALAYAEPEGYVRVFVDEGPPMARLLTSVAANLRSGKLVPTTPFTCDYVEGLLAAMSTPLDDSPQRNAPAPAAPAAAEALVEPLSEREYEVLRLLAEGMSNQDVARTLVISIATVKTHIINIYSKLHVHSRTQAVARARELLLV